MTSMATGMKTGRTCLTIAPKLEMRWLYLNDFAYRPSDRISAEIPSSMFQEFLQRFFFEFHRGFLLEFIQQFL